jgi:pilus assembly protein CpaC
MDRLRAEEIARAFGAVVVNLLSVRHPVQLKLQVRVVELSRSALKDLGITWRVGQQAPGPTATLSGGVYDLQVINGSAPGLTAVDSVIAQIDALVQRGRARLLAEPSLVVLAGRSASLLLGGQVPIPIAGPNGAVTIEYKDFGVILRVRPEYQDDGQIFLDVTPEVSTLDFADAIKIGGLTLPSLRVRRAQTVVSMTLTQTLVIGGLLQHQDAELVQKVPVLGDLPILGPLFRSKSFQSQETDLVVFVTPTLAVPVSGKPITP